MNLTCRIASIDDAADIHSLYAYYIVHTAVTFETEAPGWEAYAERMRRVLAFYPFLVCEADRKILGFAYSSRHRERAAYRWNAEISVYVDHQHRGRGIGQQLYRRLIALSRLQFLHNLVGCVTVPNPESERLHRRLGFVRTGLFPQAGYKFGRWRDVAWYGKRIASPVEEPPEPRALSSCPADAVHRILQGEPDA